MIFDGIESQVRYYCRRTPNVFAKAQGSRVWDREGREFIDFMAACGSLNLGHNDPKIKQALISYLLEDGIGNALDFHTEAKAKFIERFQQEILKPRELTYVLQFTGPTGANCVEAALKLARKATGRRSIVAFTNAFHGMSTGALAVTGSTVARSGLVGTLDGVVRLPFEGYCGSGVQELERFAEMVADPSGGIDPVAAFIAETVQGEGGLNVASTGWLVKLREVATRLGALLIVDDVQAGCGRTGPFFSFERAGIVPDMVCLSKSISGFGLPMSLLLLSPKIDRWQPGEHSGTFRGNSLAFVAATAALEYWSHASFADETLSRSKALDRWLESVVSRNSAVVRRKKGLGMMAGLEFKDPVVADAVMQEARDRRVLIEGCGPHDEVLKIMAPLNIEMELFTEGLNRLESAIDAVCAISRAA